MNDFLFWIEIKLTFATHAMLLWLARRIHKIGMGLAALADPIYGYVYDDLERLRNVAKENTRNG